MIMSQPVHFNDIRVNVPGQNRAQIIKECSKSIAEGSRVNAEVLYNGFCEKKRLERACLGEGLAVLDMRVRGLAAPYIQLATFSQDIDFEAADKLPVNIAAFIISPEREGPLHLRRLSRVVRMLRNEELRKSIVNAENADVVRTVLSGAQGWLMAA